MMGKQSDVVTEEAEHESDGASSKAMGHGDDDMASVGEMQNLEESDGSDTSIRKMDETLRRDRTGSQQSRNRNS